jgi:hypothetical protein
MASLRFCEVIRFAYLEGLPWLVFDLHSSLDASPLRNNLRLFFLKPSLTFGSRCHTILSSSYFPRTTRNLGQARTLPLRSHPPSARAEADALPFGNPVILYKNI